MLFLFEKIYIFRFIAYNDNRRDIRRLMHMNNAYPYNYYFTAHTVLTYSSANSISSISTSEPYDIRIVKPFPSLSDVDLK